MNSSKITIKEKTKLSKDKTKDKFNNLKANYFLQKVFGFLPESKFLTIIKYNKNIQQRLNISIKNYKEYTQIEIELIPTKKNFVGKFINIKDEYKNYIHIFFNDNNKAIKRNELKKDDKVSKIKIIIDIQVKSFYKLFYECTNIKSINFKKFKRKDIRNMEMMFGKCYSLEEINLSNFNTNNVINMQQMFIGCKLLKEINLSNFNTSNVTIMQYMFSGCSSLKEIDLSNFNIDKVTNMTAMFSGCSSLKDINLSNFNIKKETGIRCMFSNCTNELKMKVRAQIQNISEEAFIKVGF